MSVNRTSLGKRISFYRSKSNLTQEVLAAKVNCSREYIVQIENGTKALGQVFRVHLIDHALDRHQHPVPALSAQAVIIIIDGDKSYAEQRKHLFQILTCFHEIAAQTREQLDKS